MIDINRIKSATPVITALVACIVMIATLAFSCTARAQERVPELTPQQKLTVLWVAANAVTAFVVGAPVFIYASVAGKQKELCDAMHGKYDLTAKDICEGGDWVRVIPYLRDIKE